MGLKKKIFVRSSFILVSETVVHLLCWMYICCRVAPEVDHLGGSTHLLKADRATGSAYL